MEKGFWEAPPRVINKVILTAQVFFLYIKFLVKQMSKDGKWRVLVFDGYGAHTMVKSTVDYLIKSYTCCLYAFPYITVFGATGCLLFWHREALVLVVVVRHPVQARDRCSLKMGNAMYFWDEQGCSLSNIISGFTKFGILGITSEG
jgi:hypothetical protein